MLRRRSEGDRTNLTAGGKTMAQSHLLVGSGAQPADLPIRRIGPADLLDALAKGLDDFAAAPSHALFLCLIYPIIGLIVIAVTLGFNLVPLVYPMAAGFALVGPVAALGLYELSRRREAGLPVSAADALNVLRSPSIGAIVALGVVLMLLFLIWIAVARAIYIANFGYAAPASIGQFLHDVLFTRPGWNLIVAGNLAGLLFAIIAFLISVVSFPLLLDRDVGAVGAVVTSLRVVAANPATMGLWGLIVVGLLLIGSLPLFLGLTVVLPVLGHATWHLYRKTVEPDPNPRPEYRPLPQEPRYAADFPVALLPWARRRRRSDQEDQS